MARLSAALAFTVIALSVLPSLPAAAAPWCPKPADPATAQAEAKRLAKLLDRPPAPLAHVHTEGTLPHQGVRDASIAAERDLPIMRDAALVWRGGGEEPYLEMAERYLQAWVATYRPDFNPIDETNFEALIQTYAIIGDRLPPAERAQDETFLRHWAEGYLGSMSTGGFGGTWTNNWQSHRVKLVTLIAAALDDPTLWARARTAFRHQLSDNILPDGEVIDFEQRDALHYVVYDLEPLVEAALAARRRGEDWYAMPASNGASLKKALAWLTPYARGERTHQEFVHSKVRFDAQRAAAGLKGYSGPWGPETAGRLYWAAAELDPAYLALAQALMPRPPAEIALCGP